MSVSVDTLVDSVAFGSPFSTISVLAKMRPTGPEGGKVAPPSYPTVDTREGPYLIDKRWLDGAERKVVLLDSEQSEANRCEEALRDAADDGLVDLPMFELITKVETDAGVRTVRLTSLDFPHRYADAYLRDSMLEGIDFDKTDIGKAFRRADNRHARALYEREPYSLVYGAWDSHRKGRQAKFPRIYDSTIIGLDPVGGFRAGGRLDPLNLTGAQQPDGDGWAYIADGEKKKGNKLSKIGHGNALDSGGALGQVAISSARRMATIHLAALQGLRFGSDVSAEATSAGRAALVALALMGDRLAFGRAAVFLRSGCELGVTEETLMFETPTGGGEPFTLSPHESIELFNQAVERAAKAGLAMASDRVGLAPIKGLANAIEFAFTKAENP